MSVKDNKLGPLECIMLLVGVMIGSAIFSLSGLTILTAGPAASISWGLGGLIMLAYGLTQGELACRYPQSGGVYYFPRQAFGGKMGLVMGWLSGWGAILTNIVAVAFSAIYVGQYLSVSFPWASGKQVPIALASILICLVLNLLRADITGKINALIVTVLLGTLVTYVTTAFFGGNYTPSQLTPFFTQGTEGATGVLSAIPTAIIGYSGVVALAYLVSDVRNPRRTMPLAMLIAVLIVMTIYVLVVLSTVGLVSAGYLADNPNMQFIPLFAACFTKLTSIPWLTAVVSISAVLALMTTMLVCISMNARALQAASKDGILPRFMGKEPANGVPVAACLATSLVPGACSCFPKMTSQIVNFGAVFNIITMLLVLLALIKSRQDAPATDLEFRAPGGKAMPYILLVVLVLCNAAGILNCGKMLWFYTIVFLVLGALMLIPALLKKQ